MAEAFGQIERPVIRFADFGCGVAFRCHDRGSQSRQQVELLCQPPVRLGKSAAQCQGPPQKVGGFRIGVPVTRIRSRPRVVLDCFFRCIAGIFRVIRRLLSLFLCFVGCLSRCF